MTKRALLRAGAYYDSVTLMQVTNAVRALPGVRGAMIGMGTDFNLDSLRRLNLFLPELKDAGPNDLIFCVEAESDEAAANALAGAEKLLVERKAARAGGDDIPAPASLDGALKALPDANIVLISVPGRYAADEARKALRAGRHVMIFSDNVSIEDEVALKTEAAEAGLLVMGPDCGTAIINGVPLAFANAVRRGDIGIVAASGTGLQEASSLIHRFGFGITHAVGVGGRDLSAKVDGRMTRLAAEALGQDPDTKVILLISKPPAPEVQRKLFEDLRRIRKPIVVYFIGADPKEIESFGFRSATSLEDAARQACFASSGRLLEPLVSDAEIDGQIAGITVTEGYLRGLYSGGTLCDEAQRVLLPVLGAVSSNTPIAGVSRLADIQKSAGHTIVDLGDDDFTRGRAHPMIDPTARVERLKAEFRDPETAMILLDVVLGYGAHPDMGGVLAAAVTEARMEKGHRPVIAACLCGTDEDPQDANEQAKRLRAAGIVVFPSHSSLVRFARSAFNVQRSEFSVQKSGLK